MPDTEIDGGQDYIDAMTRLARHLHAGQADKLGEPFHRHLEAVAAILRQRFPTATADEIGGALLHDSIEDGRADRARLLAEGATERTVHLAEQLARPAGQPYLPWIEALCAAGDRGVLRIKLADNLHNGDPARAHPDRDRMMRDRYLPARALLETTLARLG